MTVTNKLARLIDDYGYYMWINQLLNHMKADNIFS